MSLREQVIVGSSPIHGKGLFARKRFREGACIGRFEGRETRRDGAHVLWVVRDDGSYLGIQGTNELRFLNHSRRPNAEFRGDELFAVRNIQPGAEITFDYGDEWADID